MNQEIEDKISVDAEAVQYTSWKVLLDDISIIGEYTTPCGPVSEDYFIAFVDREGKVYDAPMSALEFATTDFLHARIGHFCFGLANSTDLRSRIMWPPAYANEPLFAFTPVEPTTLQDRIRKLIGGYVVDLDLSPRAIDALRRD
jgi:hypothetical protein